MLLFNFTAHPMVADAKVSPVIFPRIKPRAFQELFFKVIAKKIRFSDDVLVRRAQVFFALDDLIVF
jgi:hypothetical protein